jgi:hypothetical protein
MRVRRGVIHEYPLALSHAPVPVTPAAAVIAPIMNCMHMGGSVTPRRERRKIAGRGVGLGKTGRPGAALGGVGAPDRGTGARSGSGTVRGTGINDARSSSAARRACSMASVMTLSPAILHLGAVVLEA